MIVVRGVSCISLLPRPRNNSGNTRIRLPSPTLRSNNTRCAKLVCPTTILSTRATTSHRYRSFRRAKSLVSARSISRRIAFPKCARERTQKCAQLISALSRPPSCDCSAIMNYISCNDIAINYALPTRARALFFRPAGAYFRINGSL